MLLLGRKEGEGIYVGRVARVTFSEIGETDVVITVEHEPIIAVSDYDVPGATHIAEQLKAESSTDTRKKVKTFTLAASEDVRIGRGVTVKVMEIKPDSVTIGVDAPRHIAVSRDDFTLQEHLKYQAARELPRRFK